MGTITYGQIFQLHSIYCTSPISQWCRGFITQQISVFCICNTNVFKHAVFLTLIASWIKCFNI